MKKLLILCLLFTACKKQQPEEFALTLNVSGFGNYQYAIGSEKHSGHCSSSIAFTAVAHSGDDVTLAAQGDSIKVAPYQNAMTIQITGDNPLSGTSPKLEHKFQ